MKKIFFLLPFLSLVLTDSYAQFSMLDPRFSDDFIVPENYWGPKDTLANHVEILYASSNIMLSIPFSMKQETII